MIVSPALVESRQHVPIGYSGSGTPINFRNIIRNYDFERVSPAQCVFSSLGPSHGSNEFTIIIGDLIDSLNVNGLGMAARHSSPVKGVWVMGDPHSTPKL